MTSRRPHHFLAQALPCARPRLFAGAMGKNSHVKVKTEGGRILARKGKGQKNFGRLQTGDHSMNPGAPPRCPALAPPPALDAHPRRPWRGRPTEQDGDDAPFG